MPKPTSSARIAQQNSKLKKDAFIGKKAQWAAHRVAEKHGLTSAKRLMINKIKEAEKSPAKITKQKIFAKHLDVMNQKPVTFNKYSEQMASLGSEFIPAINKKGLLQGFNIKDLDSGELFKASDIHKSMGLKNLLEAGLPLDDNIALFPTLIESQKKALLKAAEFQSQMELQRQAVVEKENEITKTQYFYKR